MVLRSSSGNAFEALKLDDDIGVSFDACKREKGAEKVRSSWRLGAVLAQRSPPHGDTSKPHISSSMSHNRRSDLAECIMPC